MKDVETRSWLSSVLAVCEHEAQALEALGDERLGRVLRAMSTLKAEIVAALAALTPDSKAAIRRYLGAVGAREERLANNEVLFRDINERIALVAEPQARPRDDHIYEFFCECSSIGCDTRLPLTLTVYEDVRRDPTHFVVAPGHELPEIESVISRTDGYQVVRKQGDAAEFAEEKDPRG